MDIEILKKKLGLRLKELRVAKGLRQEDLEKWEFSYRYYGKLERGIVNPTVETLAKLCDIFGVTLSDLFLFMDDKSSSSEEKEKIALKIADVLKDGRKAKLQKLNVFLDEIL
jgi:transcriptional regulator with XRE-family HTH domain